LVGYANARMRAQIEPLVRVAGDVHYKQAQQERGCRVR
jgi:hypothetical protein